MKVLNLIKNIEKLFIRLIKKPNWHNLRNLEPISRVFGFYRRTPIDYRGHPQ